MSGYVPQPADPGVPSPAEPVASLDRTGGYLGPTGQAAVAAASRATPARWRLLLRRPTFFVGAGILLFWVVCAVFGHLFAPYNPLAQNLLANNAAPSGAHWFGTDPLGRDVLSRVIVGARDILFVVAVGSSVVSITIIIGLVFTPLIARTVRTAVLVERHQDYVSASRLLGESPARVMFAEILPNVMPAIVV